ncbi:MAG: site-specific integrase, partial [Ignavibacteria bacterium]|nr:site-specific integrase [Ignavibacteria bacterium]
MSVALRKRKLPSGRTQLYLDIYRAGNRSTEALGFFLEKNDRFQNRETMKMAEEIRAKRQLDFQADAHGLSGTHNRKASFIKYLEAQKELRKKPRTKALWRISTTHFSDFAGGGVVFGDLTPQLFEKFKIYLLNRVGANSAHSYFAHIKTALNQAVKDNILAVNPAKATIRKTETLPVHLSIKEIRKLAKTPCGNDQVKQAFLFSCFSGLRFSDVERLTWDKVKDDYLEYTQIKTGAPERLPLSSEALRILRKQKKAKPSPNIQREFPSNTVFFMPIQVGVDRHLKNWGKAAEIVKPLSFHKARHSFATIALSSGIDIYTVSKLLGHKNLATTQIYAKVVDETKRA